MNAAGAPRLRDAPGERRAGGRLTVLQVAFPLAAVGPAAVGGAEQVLAQLDRALTGVGHRPGVGASRAEG